MLAFFVQLTFAVMAFSEVLNPTTTIKFPGETTPPFYINNNASDYQDMEKLIETGEKEYIYYRSYDRDPLFGNQGMCPYLKRRPKKETPRPLKLIMGYQRPNGSEVRFKRPAEYQMWQGYSVKNILWIKEGNHHNTTRLYTLVFTDNSTCSVVKSSLRDGCEVWVPESALSQGPSPCCNFLYQLLCGQEKYQKYNASCTMDETSIPSPPEGEDYQDSNEEGANKQE